MKETSFDDYPDPDHEVLRAIQQAEAIIYGNRLLTDGDKIAAVNFAENFINQRQRQGQEIDLPKESFRSRLADLINHHIITISLLGGVSLGAVTSYGAIKLLGHDANTPLGIAYILSTTFLANVLASVNANIACYFVEDLLRKK